MAQQKGRELIIKIGDGGDPETFTNFAGLQTRSFNLSVNEVETTVPDKDDPGEVVQRTATAGIRSQSFSGDGLFDNDTESQTAVDAALNGTPINAQVVVPGVGTFEGPWIISGLEFSGGMEDNLGFSATFSASDALTFTKAA